MLGTLHQSRKRSPGLFSPALSQIILNQINNFFICLREQRFDVSV